jgi:hypothetical protein
MYQKFWNQFLLEQDDAPSTFILGDEKPTKPDPKQERRPLTGLKLFLSEKGYYLDKLLGSGQDGKVYKATNKKTGQTVAIKTIDADQGGGASAEREVKNYKFVKDNYNSFGGYKKYLPVVYEASMEDIPVQGEGMDGTKKKQGFIVMEQLEPLPNVARSLFAALGNSERNKRAREIRDKRLLKNPKLVSSLLNIAWSLMGQEGNYLTMDAQLAAEKRIMERFFAGRLPAVRPEPYIRKMAMSEMGKKLMMLYIQITYEEMLKHSESEEHGNIIHQYKQHMKESLLISFEKAYSKPLVSGAEGRELSQTSALRGMDQFYGQEDELEQEFPEIMFVRDAMKRFADREFRPFDVHAGNVMMRPGTNDIVIVDLGRFNT